jgi:hypothetical protein
MRALLALLLVAPLALAARPVAAPMRGSLDDRGVFEDAAGVVVEFDNVSKAEAQQRLDALVRQRRLSGALRVGFFKTDRASLAAIYFLANRTVTLKSLKELAAACAQMEGTKQAWAFLHPGPRDETLEVEAYWRYRRGEQPEEKRLAFRDDEAWVQALRQQISPHRLESKKWPGWPLSQMAMTLGIPGRDFLERPWALLDLAIWNFPRDVGANQVLTTVFLPDATALEIRQQAEKEHASVSKLVQEAVIATSTAEKLGIAANIADRAPWDEEMPNAGKGTERELPLFLTLEVWGLLDDAATKESLSGSKIVEYAWRVQHPFVDPKKKK